MCRKKHTTAPHYPHPTFPAFHIYNTTTLLLHNLYTTKKHHISTTLHFYLSHLPYLPSTKYLFLGRCLNKRYWEHGNKWRIELEVNDDPYPNQMRPIVYFLYRPIDKNSIPQTKEIDIIEECESLISCMNSHYKHEIFMTNYNMNRGVYYLEDEMAWDREEKLNTLGL